MLTPKNIDKEQIEIYQKLRQIDLNKTKKKTVLN